MNTKIKKQNNLIDTLFETKWTIYFIFSLTALIVLPNLNRESLWFDEIYSATASLKVTSLHAMFTQYIFKDVHPPLYQLVLYYWGKIVGSSDFAIRLLSYLSILASFSFSYYLLFKYSTRRIAIIYLTISAFAPGVLFYAQSARPYAILYGLANVLAVIFVIYLISIKNRKRINNSIYIAYFILGVLISYTHYFGYIIVFSLSLCAVIYAVKMHENKIAVSLVVYSLFIAAFGLVWLLIHINYGDITSKTGGNFWIKNNFLVYMRGLAGHAAGNIFGVVGFVIVLVTFASLFSKFINTIKKYMIILSPAILLLVTAYFISLSTPIITSRNLIVILPLILLFITFMFDEMYEERKIFIVICLLFLLVATAVKSFTYQKQNWRDASRYIADNFDGVTCKVPTRPTSDKSTGQEFSIYPSYYLGAEYSYSSKGPEVQDACKLIYFNGHTKERNIRKHLTEYGINVPYVILNFNEVFVVIQRQ